MRLCERRRTRFSPRVKAQPGFRAAATGAVKWKWHPTTANSGFGPTGTRRGLSVGGGRVYTLAVGNRVVAPNQNTGAHSWAVVPTRPAGETTVPAE
jgi:hypothetical protein